MRFTRLPPLGVILEKSMRHFLGMPVFAESHVPPDEKDSGAFITTHIYLLFGCALPLLFGSRMADQFFFVSGIKQKSEPSDTKGTLILGVGDSLASIFGSKLGSTKWHEGTKKSVQGTVFALVGMLIVLDIYRKDSCSQLTQQVNLMCATFWPRSWFSLMKESPSKLTTWCCLCCIVLC